MISWLWLIPTFFLGVAFMWIIIAIADDESSDADPFTDDE